ncbi:class D beta-lactamase, partial [Achromobacter ruhlandii]|nr:class D beta-lactamase [Achromobacter ruhlandii]
MTVRLVSRALGAVLFASALTLPARADVLCTLVADAADGRILFQ